MTSVVDITKPSPDRLLLPRSEAASILSISLRTLDYLIADGKLPARRLGSRVLISRRDLERFVDSLRKS